MKEAMRVFFDDPENKKRFTIFSIAGIAILSAFFLVQIFRGPKYPRDLHIDTVAAPIAKRVEKVGLDAHAPYYNKKIRYKTERFYQRTHNKTKWLEYNKPTPNYITFIHAVKEGAKYGLNPDQYELDKIEDQVVELYGNDQRTPEDIYALDIKITSSFFLFTTHLIEGRIRTAGYGDFIWKKNIPKENDIQLLAEHSRGKLSDLIDKLHSPHEQYNKLRKALEEYRTLQNEDKFVKVSLKNLRLKPGEKNSAVPSIRKKLFLTDLKEYQPDDSLIYDKKLVEGVQKFQRRHGLVADGVISQATFKHLNESFKRKADLIELNLERIRWLPTEYGKDYTSVNVPEFMLRVYENRKKKMEMRVVLGSEFNATPIFSDTLEYVVFSPTWNVPRSIFGEEMLPDLQKNALAYDPERFIFYQHGKEIHPEDVDWNDEELDTAAIKIVEQPGEENSLGLVKFIMPNSYNIYLHDSPAERLFQKNKRAFSHGCIRLEKPVEFAKYLLRDNPKWNEEKIREAMKGEEPVSVYLKKKYPVEIEYRTVWIDENDEVNFRDDIYGHDERQLAMLNRVGGI